MSEAKTIESADQKPIHACPDVLPTTKERIKGALTSPVAAVSLRGKLWKNGETITVSFEDRMATGGSELITRVKKHIQHVFDLTSLKLQFVPSGQGVIRISFARGGSWSYLGTDNKLIPKDKHTMQLGWLDQGTDSLEVQRVVRHETMHALGIGHEQAHPDARIPWDKPKVYAYFARTQGWSRTQVDAQVFQRYSPGQVDVTNFDIDSLQLYPVPNELTIGDWSVGKNTDLSSTDIRHLQSIYPKQSPQDPARLKWLRAAKRRIVIRIQTRNKANRADRARLDRVNEEIERIG